MKNDLFEIQTALQIQKPISEVYNAIVNPEAMVQYFISESTGPMEQDKQVVWKFPEFDEVAPIHVGIVKPNRYISFTWTINDRQHQVEMLLTETENNSTLVQIKERGGSNNEEGIIWLKQNTEGWANFLACLKAWLEYGIHLRKGAFDFMREKNK